jgi:hypothetical protein
MYFIISIFVIMNTLEKKRANKSQNTSVHTVTMSPQRARHQATNCTEAMYPFCITSKIMLG